MSLNRLLHDLWVKTINRFIFISHCPVLILHVKTGIPAGMFSTFGSSISSANTSLVKSSVKDYECNFRY